MPATRIEIAAHVGNVFAGGAVTRDQLVAAAQSTGARPAVVQVLERLSRGPFYEMRQLWPELPDVPIEPEPISGLPR